MRHTHLDTALKGGEERRDGNITKIHIATGSQSCFFVHSNFNLTLPPPSLSYLSSSNGTTLQPTFQPKLPATLSVFSLNSLPQKMTKQQYWSIFLSSSVWRSKSRELIPSRISLISRMSTTEINGVRDQATITNLWTTDASMHLYRTS